MFAQQGFNYKAIINDGGSPVQNQAIDIQFTILEDGVTNVYQETHNPTTDANGIVIVNIGEGTTVSGDFDVINWSNIQFLKVEVNTGSGYTDMGTTEFKYVPHAKFADEAGNVFSGDYEDLFNKPTMSGDVSGDLNNNTVEKIQGKDVSPNTPANDQVLKWNDAQQKWLPADDALGAAGTTDGVVSTVGITGTSIKTITLDRTQGLGTLTATFDDENTQLTETEVDAMVSNNGYLTSSTELDGSTTNELQDLTLTGSNLSIQNGNTVDLSNIDTETDTHLSETDVDAMVSNNGYLTSFTEVDGSTTNELQDLILTGSNLSIQNGNSVDLSNIDTDTDTHLSETEVDGSTTNELQTLSISGDQLSITDGNTITLPASGGSTDLDFLEVGTGSAPNNILDNIYHTGNISIGEDATPNAKLDIKNTGTATTANANTGLKITNNNSSTTDKIGISNNLETTSNTATIYAVKSNLLDNSDGDIFGEHTSIGGIGGNGEHTGNYVSLTGEGYGLHTGYNANLYTNGEAEQVGYNATLYTINVSNTANQTAVKAHVYGLGIGEKFGLTTLIDGDAAGNLYGTENTVSNTNNASHYGTINRMSGSGSGNHYGISNIFTGTGTGQQYGVRNFNSNSGDATHYGVYSDLNGAGSGQHIGTYNKIRGNGAGEQIATINEVTNTGDADHYGNKNVMTGTGSGDHYANYSRVTGTGTGSLYGSYNNVDATGAGVHTGVYNILSGDATGYQLGVQTEITNSGDATHYGTSNVLEGSGSGVHYGVYNRLSGAGTGVQYANYAKVNNSGNAAHYGHFTELSGTGYGVHYANYNFLTGAGAGQQYGTKTAIDNSNNSYHYGLYNNMNGSGSGRHYGTYNYMYGSGTGIQYAAYNKVSTSGNGSHYGSYNSLSGSGSGNKYGVYSSISSTAGGTHYAIYGSALKAGAYAGYFNGDVKVTKELHGDDSGDADMKAYIYGIVEGTDGSIKTNASSDGFTVVRNSMGDHTITFLNSPGGSDKYMVMVEVETGNTRSAYVESKGADSFQIKVKNGAYDSNYDFKFIVYKK